MNEIPDYESAPKPGSIRYWLLLISAFSQLIALIITWPLWNVRAEVPHLPVFDLGIPQISWAWILVATLAVIPFRPKEGVWLHFAVMLVACLFDQMRTQPQFLATWILMFALLKRSYQNYARWFLCSLWIWAGLHKAISPDWNSYQAWNMTRAIGLDPETWYIVVGIAVAATEILVGLLGWWKPKWGAVGCVMLHAGILIYLSPLFRNWNYSVFPWNLATAIVGFWILWTCDARPKVLHRALFAIFMVLPAGFYVGCVDHGYSHVLYSDCTPLGLVTRTDGSVESIDGWGELNIPFPCERRTLRQRFEAVAEDGDRLHILDPRPALDDLHFVKRGGESQLIDRDEFFAENSQNIAGVELDFRRHRFALELAGARMLKRTKQTMIYAIEFKPEFFEVDQLKHLRFLPNIEEVQLSKTDITDEDLKLLLDLPKLRAIGLDQTGITDHGLEILKRSKTLKNIEAKDSQISLETLLDFLDSRNP